MIWPVRKGADDENRVDTPRLSVVVPTLGNYAVLQRVLDGYEYQDDAAGTFEVIVVSDRAERDPHAVDAAIGKRPYPVRRLTGTVAGASGNRNTGWQAARAPVVLFTDDDTIPVRRLVREHLDTHHRFPEEQVAVAGHVRWATGLKVTPFMKWLDDGVQFNFGALQGDQGSWATLYSANASIKRSFIERVGGYDEERFPYGYEDLDWGYRAKEHGLRVIYNRRAIVDHWRPMTVDLWKARAPRLAATEWQFCSLYPEIEPWFWRMFSNAMEAEACGNKARKLVRWVPRWLPWLGPELWKRADMQWRQEIAPHFLEAWERAAAGDAAAQPSVEALLAERSAGPESG